MMGLPTEVHVAYVKQNKIARARTIALITIHTATISGSCAECVGEFDEAVADDVVLFLAW